MNSGTSPRATFAFWKSDLADPAQRERIIDAAGFLRAQGAIHLAGLKAVGESVTSPSAITVNLGSALTLIDVLKATGGKTHRLFLFRNRLRRPEQKAPSTRQACSASTNPYGRTKYFIEEMLRDLHVSDPLEDRELALLQSVGAHPSGRIGEDPNGVPNNLFPYIAQVAVGRREKLRVFGDDYDTRDGTGVRDFIHVCDLARGHRAALDHLAREKAPGVVDVNLGTGLGYSVLEAVAAFKRASNRDIPYEIAPRREGDIAEIYANPSKAKSLLGWTAEKSLDDMCADHWRWQRENPTGYGE
ncbi:MAG: GDP-mannose 4,6-dehydratase [Parvularculaceae bacterium]